MLLRAFGIDVETELSVPALTPATAAATSPLRLVAVPAAELGREWPAEEAECVEQIQFPDGSVGLRIDRHAEAGYLMDAGRFGRYRLDAAATVARCEEGIEPWRRERFLVARVLPIAALVRGMELLHASGVTIGGDAIAIAGPSHSGKTSLALRLALAGAPLLTDDLLAISVSDGEVVAHPGTGLVGVRHGEAELLTAADRARLDPLVDRGDKLYGRLPLAPEPQPLRRLYFLEPDPTVSEAAFIAETPPDPRRLLGSVFFGHLELTERRLTNQLELLGALTGGAAAFRVAFPATVGAEQLAGEIRDHAAAEPTAIPVQ